mgnify:CR=1 FL=1
MHGKVLGAFRNNDFNPESAIAELVDNSLQADCKNMKIRLKFDTPIGKNKPRAYEIAFGDDGYGMNDKTLQNCLVLGESTRTNDRHGIGRFGVGMTNGAISVCPKIQVYSREHQGNWSYVELDLRNVDPTGSPYVTFVEQKSLPKDYKDLVGDFGTLVIWSDIDRIHASFKTSELKHWLGRTFRKYIGDKIIKNKKIIDNPNKVTLIMDVTGESNETDGLSEVHAFDPLYVVPNKNRSTDTTAELIDEWEIEFEVSDIDAPDDGTKVGSMTIRMSFTPEDWRPTGGSGGSEANNARHLRDNEGISILRHHREVFYDKIMFWSTTLKDVDRWWSCEIDFDPVLDHQFSVKNVKVGARPLNDLRLELQTEINPTRKTLLDRVMEVWAKAKAKDITDPEPGLPRPSDPGQPKPKSKPKPLTAEQKKEIEEAIKKKKLKEAEQKAIIERITDPKSPEIIIQERTSDVKSGDNYMEIEHLGNKTVVWLNMKHDFFQKSYHKIKEINTLADKSDDPEKTNLVNIATDLKIDIDNMIISYVMSRNILNKLGQFDDDVQNDLMYQWSQALRKLYRNMSDK